MIWLGIAFLVLLAVTTPMFYGASIVEKIVSHFVKIPP
jgi:hypothetical protein